jgi:two-component system LytT family response regulator
MMRPKMAPSTRPIGIESKTAPNEVFGNAPMTRLFVRSGRAIVPIVVSDVSHFDADGDYVMAHTNRSRVLVHVALSCLERRLDASRFVRVHRAHIVNFDRRSQVSGRRSQFP